MSRLSKLVPLLHRLSRLVRGFVFYEHWTIGIVDQSIFKSLGWKPLPPVRWIDTLNHTRTISDGFPWPGSHDTLVCTTKNLETQAQYLSAIKINPKGIVAEVALDLPLPGPLSFPFTFMRDGIVYVMASACGRLEIFRWVEENGAWASDAVIFENKPVANPILFEKDGWFWIVYTDLTQPSRDNLCLAYSSRIGGPWRLHCANPINAGPNAGPIFAEEGRIYRLARDVSDYPRAIRVMEIVACTPLSYIEQETLRIVPSSRDFPDGIRTIVPWGKRCLVDGMRLRFSWSQLWGKIDRKHRVRQCLRFLMVKVRGLKTI